MSMPLKVSTEAVIAAYAETKSVWKAGALLGISGQTVANRIKAAGIKSQANPLTEADLATIREYYTTTAPEDFDLKALSVRLGRTVPLISRAAGKLGLSNIRRSVSSATLAVFKERAKDRWQRQPHPRGMLGKKHSAETLKLVSEASKRNWSTWRAFGIGQMTPEALEGRRTRFAAARAKVNPDNTYSRCRSGRRPDLGETFFRSSWEANYARYLNLLQRMKVIAEWAYEPQTFHFPGEKNGAISYKPDFRVVYRGDPVPEYIELKGWETSKDRTKWRRMAKHHPTIKLVVVGEKQYNALARKWASSLPEWEGSKGGGRKTGPRRRAA